MTKLTKKMLGRYRIAQFDEHTLRHVAFHQIDAVHYDLDIIHRVMTGAVNSIRIGRVKVCPYLPDRASPERVHLQPAQCASPILLKVFTEQVVFIEREKQAPSASAAAQTYQILGPIPIQVWRIFWMRNPRALCLLATSLAVWMERRQNLP